MRRARRLIDSIRWHYLLPPACRFFAVLAFYLLTLAPTVLWGDDAEFQRRAYTLELGAGLTDHPLYLVWAHVFTYLPVGDIAYRVNLCSATGAAAGVAIAYAILRRIGAERQGAAIGAGALAVSHAYWMHAVRAEVYSTYLVLFLAFIWAGVRWLEEGNADALSPHATTLTPAAGAHRGIWLALASFFLALSLSVHMLALTALAGLLVLYGRARAPRQFLAGLGGLAGGLVPLVFFLLFGGVGRLTEQAGNLLSMSLPAPSRWPKDAAFMVGYLLYQFPVVIFLAWPGMRWLWAGRRWSLAFLSLVALGDFTFAFDFQAPDRYVFYLPAYTVVTIWIGLGAEWLIQRKKGPARCTFSLPGRGNDERLVRVSSEHAKTEPSVKRLCITLMVTATLLPVFIYAALPTGLNVLGLNPFRFRNLPYRNGNLFHLLPAKAGYIGPRYFGQQVMASLPDDASILADATIRQNLLYFQRVDGLKPAVEIVEIYSGYGEQVPFIESRINQRPVFLGAIDRYLDREEIEARFQIEPYGLIYRVVPRGGEDAGSY